MSWCSDQCTIAPLHEADLTQEDICFTCRTEDETDLNLGTSFSAETNRRDEDADMYVHLVQYSVETLWSDLS